MDRDANKLAKRIVEFEYEQNRMKSHSNLYGKRMTEQEFEQYSQDFLEFTDEMLEKYSETPEQRSEFCLLVERKAEELGSSCPNVIFVPEQKEKVIEEEEDNTEPVVTIEGVLKMYLFHGADESSEIFEYQETNYIDDYLAFILEMDKGIDVSPYVDDLGRELLIEWDGTVQSDFMIVSENQSFDKDFASKYANKRVRVTGSLYVPMAGWRNVTMVVMGMDEIKLAK